MKTLLLSILVMLTLSANGQKITVSEHPISGEATVETSWEHFFARGVKTRGFEMDIRLIRKDGDYTMQLRITDEVRTHLVSEGQMLGFYSGEKKIAALKCTDGNRSRDPADLISYPVTENQIENLLESDIDVIKFEWERGITVDKINKGDLKAFKNSLSLIKDNMMADDKTNVLSGWMKLYKGSEPKTVIWQRIIGTDTGSFIEIKMFGHTLKKGHRLNIYNGKNKISLFATSVSYQHSGASGRDYSFALFPVTNANLLFMSQSDYARMTLQTTTDKIYIEDMKKSLVNDLKDAAERSQIISSK